MKGYFRKRGNSWSFTVDIGRDPITGKRRQKTKGGFKTKKEAQVACAEFITMIEKEGFVETKKVTLSSFMKEYIETEIKPNYRQTTVNNYKNTLSKVDETIGHIELSKLNALHIQQFVKHIRENLKNNTVNLYLTCFKRILNVAFEWRLISYDIGRVIKKPKSERKIEKYWTYDECMSFLDKMKNDRYYLIYLLTIFTGMRRGEILGLSEKNCDFENNRITVNQQVIIVDGQPVISNKLKSKSSYRIIDVPADIMQQLKKYNLEQKKKFLQLGIKKEADLIFVTQEGKIMSPNYLSRRFRMSCEKHGFRNISFHGLRHSHATILAELKENVHAIADRLGHSSPVITNEMYIHLTEKMKSSLADRLEMLYKESKSSM
jgi:integrase